VIPFYRKTPDFREPEDSVYYLLAAEGVFTVKKTPLFCAVTRAERVAGLESQEDHVTLSIPLVPARVMEMAFGFFDEIYRCCGGEAIVILYYAPKLRRYRIAVPPQDVTLYRVHFGWRARMHLRYRTLPRPEGYLKLGDIHSHGGYPANFSRTDDHDDHEDGLRLILGRLNRAKPEISASFVTGGVRFLLDHEKVHEPFVRSLPPPPKWMDRVTWIYEGAKEFRREGDATRHA
jgi:hypothetical protein